MARSGGDELNLIEPGKNYGWPLVSYAVNYNGVPIPSPDTRPDLTKPVIYWTPIIAPGNLTFYNGAMFPQWKGSALIGGMATMTLNRITFDGKGGATPAERWNVGHRIRDIEVAPDGAVWMLEDANPGGLFRVTPKSNVRSVHSRACARLWTSSCAISTPASSRQTGSPLNVHVLQHAPFEDVGSMAGWLAAQRAHVTYTRFYEVAAAYRILPASISSSPWVGR